MLYGFSAPQRLRINEVNVHEDPKGPYRYRTDYHAKPSFVLAAMNHNIMETSFCGMPSVKGNLLNHRLSWSSSWQKCVPGNSWWTYQQSSCIHVNIVSVHFRVHFLAHGIVSDIHSRSHGSPSGRTFTHESVTRYIETHSCSCFIVLQYGFLIRKAWSFMWSVRLIW